MDDDHDHTQSLDPRQLGLIVATYADAPPEAPTAAPVVDPDHFAIAETDYSDESFLDDLWAWLADRIGDRSEVYEDDEAIAERARRWTTRTIAIAALFLLVLNALSLKVWASTLPPTWGSETLRLVAGEWFDRTSAIGLDQPRKSVHDAYEAQKQRKW
jgi:hypothetical protein